MTRSITSPLESPQPFNRAAIKDKFLTVMVNGKPVAIPVSKMSDDTIRKAMRIQSNERALSSGWSRLPNGTIVQNGLSGQPNGGITTESHVDPTKNYPTPRPVSPPPVSTTPNPGPGTPAPITEGVEVPGVQGAAFNTAGGNRTNKHISAGPGSNIGYADGKLLNRARDVYAGSVGDGPNKLGHYGFFGGAPSTKPGRQSLNSMHHSSMGEVEYMGKGNENTWHRPAGGPVRQGTVLPNKGDEYGSAWQDYKKPSINNNMMPANPVGPNTATGQNNNVAAPTVARPSTAAGQNNAPDPAVGGQANSNQQHSQMIQNWKVGQEYMGRTIVGGTWLVRPGGKKVYVPIVNTSGDPSSKTAIHPAWAGLRN